MYALKNKVQLIGNLGNNPEICTKDAGKKWPGLALLRIKAIAMPKVKKLQKRNGTI